MAFFLKCQTLADKVEGVKVFQLSLGAKFFLAIRTDGNIGIDPHGALFHLDIRDPSVLDDFLEGSQIGISFFWTAHICFGYNLNQWHSLAVEVHIRIAVTTVGILSGIFFQVGPLDTDFLGRAIF